ncbi:MAG: LysR family transcriptional regulator [Sphingomonadaceae bacterium]|nr:LysR family transcriptional regulator [Sphingomonadaceae bacterium]
MLDPGDLDDLIAIWRAGSLSAAAKRRGVAISTISRRIEALEVALKLRLIDRQARGTRLTRHGEVVAKAAEPIAEQLARVSRLADSLRSEGGTVPVRLSATEFVISDVLAPALPALWQKGGDFPVHLQSQADVVSLAARDADIAVRMSRPEGASLIIRKLPTLHLGFFASKTYLANRDPAKLDLSRERLLIYDDSYGRLPELAWLEGAGLRPAVAMRTGSTRGLMTAAIAGAGIALLPNAIARRSDALLQVDARSLPPPRVPWLIVHRDLRAQPSIRLVHKWVLETFDALVRV